MSYSLDYIWDYIESQKRYASEEEKAIVSKLAISEKELTENLGDKQKELFNNFTNIMSELNYLDRKESFIVGVRFATGFLLEAIDK